MMINYVPELRYPRLPFRRFRAVCKTEHTRRLALPWYVSTDPSSNSKQNIWRRQVRRYAVWYARTKLSWLAPEHALHVSDAGGIYSGSQLLGYLPEHVKLGYTQEQPTCLP